MSRLNNAVRRIARVVRSAVRDRQLTSDSLDVLPSVVRGAKFSREAVVSRKRANGSEANEETNPLLVYFQDYQQGPGIWKWMHYFDIYHRHFKKFVGREVHLLEVGIYSGGSLPMWRQYFGTDCRVYGIDIEKDCLVYEDDRTKVFIGDQADRSFWKKVKEAAPQIDILIDDGGHQPEQQLITLEEMLPHLRPGGVYLCEDIHGADNRFSGYLHGLASSLHATAPCPMPVGVDGLAHTPSEFQAAIDSIHLYPFVAVIEKREQILDQLIAPKHGTKWQPFF